MLTLGDVFESWKGFIRPRMADVVFEATGHRPTRNYLYRADQDPFIRKVMDNTNRIIADVEGEPGNAS